VEFVLGPAVFDRDVLVLDVADFLHALAELAHTVRQPVRRPAVEKLDHRHRRLLRARRKRPRRRTAEQRERTLSSASAGLEPYELQRHRHAYLGVASCQSEILSLKKAVWRLWLVSKSRTKSSAEGCEEPLRRAASVARPQSSPSHARTALSR